METVCYFCHVWLENPRTDRYPNGCFYENVFRRIQLCPYHLMFWILLLIWKSLLTYFIVILYLMKMILRDYDFLNVESVVSTVDHSMERSHLRKTFVFIKGSLTLKIKLISFYYQLCTMFSDSSTYCLLPREYKTPFSLTGLSCPLIFL